MKFSIAAAAIAATSSFVGVHASSSKSSTSTSKSGKGSCSSSPKLEKFCNQEPANFEGRYNSCYYNIVRNAASGPSGVSFQRCFSEAGAFRDDDLVFTALDEFGAYTAADILDPVMFPKGATKNFQGIAQGNSIKMTSYGAGIVNNTDGTVLIPNDTPDTKECTVYEDGLLKCIDYFQEYCSPDDSSFFPSTDCEEGEWLMTYTVESVNALKGFECPEAPVGFCPSGGPVRKLQEEEASHPCPILNGKMN